MELPRFGTFENIEELMDMALSAPWRDLYDQYPDAALFAMRQAVLSIYRQQMFDYLKHNCGKNPSQQPLAVYCDCRLYFDSVDFGIVWDDGVIMEKRFVYSYATKNPPQDRETPLTKESLHDWAQNCLCERIDWKK